MDIKIEPKKNYQAGIRLTEETYLKLKVLAVSKKSTVGEVLRAIIKIYFKEKND